MNTIINTAKHGENTVEDKVLAAMKDAGKPVRPGDVAKTLGVESKDVSKAIKDLDYDPEKINPLYA